MDDVCEINDRDAGRAPLLCAALCAMPSFLQGAARVFDLGSRFNLNVYNYSPTVEDADAWAMYRDWQALGDDMRSVFETSGMRVEIENRRP